MALIGPLQLPPLGAARGNTGNVQIAPTGWDKCVLAGQTIPGFCRITRGGVRCKIDHKPKKGADGANPTTGGVDPQPLELEIRTFTDDDREQLASMCKDFVPQQGKKPEPISIDHPSLRAIGITSVLVVGVSPLMVEGPMRARMTFDLLHWLPAKNADATNTPKAAPVRKINNTRAKQNPPPTQQKGFGGPPANVTPGG